MSIFTEHLRGEAGVIQLALNRLESRRKSLIEDKSAQIEELRLLVYALRILFKRNHLSKLDALVNAIPDAAAKLEKDAENFNPNTTSLYGCEAKVYLLRLQLALDNFINDQNVETLIQALSDCIQVVSFVIDVELNVLLPMAEKLLSEETHGALFASAREIDRKQNFDRIQATRLLLNPQPGRNATGF